MHLDAGIGLIWYGVFVGSTVCHEASHAWTSLRLGDKTAARGGQVSLNPWPHVRREPLGMIAAPVLSWLLAHWMFGWASAPFNPQWAHRNPHKAAVMLMAGPGANLAIALFAGLLIRLGLACDVFTAPATLFGGQLAAATAGGLWPLLANILSVAVALNLLLGALNLVPLAPLDGNGIPVFLLSTESARKYLTATHGPVARYAGLLVIPWLISPLFSGLTRLAAWVLYPHLHFV